MKYSETIQNEKNNGNKWKITKDGMKNKEVIQLKFVSLFLWLNSSH